MSLLSAFNNLLAQFIDELVMTFPELTDLLTIQTVLGLMKRANPRMILSNFLAVAGRYHIKIFKEDEAFFQDLENWKNDPYVQSEFSQRGEDDDLFARLMVFKDVWKDLSHSNKEHIWTYLKQLLVLGAKANKDPALQNRAETILSAAVNIHK